jgi:uncharacterized protein YggE
MSKNIKLLILVTLVFVILAALTTAFTVAVTEVRSVAKPQSVTAPQVESPTIPRTITVVGEGVLSLKPDMATIDVGAEARAATASEAKEMVDERMDRIIAALHEAGVVDKDIQTSHYYIHYEREPVPVIGDGTITETQGAYFVTNMVQVTIREVDKVGDVLDASVQAGANQMHGVSFTVSDESVWQDQSRAEAMADARERAQELAELAGVQLGEVLTVSEIIGGVQLPGLMARPMGGGGGGVDPGELELRSQIQVVFGVY